MKFLRITLFTVVIGVNFISHAMMEHKTQEASQSKLIHLAVKHCTYEKAAAGNIKTLIKSWNIGPLSPSVIDCIFSEVPYWIFDERVLRDDSLEIRLKNTIAKYIGKKISEFTFCIHPYRTLDQAYGIELPENLYGPYNHGHIPEKPCLYIYDHLPAQ